MDAHLSLTGGGMLNPGNSFALGLSNSIANLFLFHRACILYRADGVAAGRTLPACAAAPLPRAP